MVTPPVIAVGSGRKRSVGPHTSRINFSMTSAAPNVSSRPYSGSRPYVRRRHSSSSMPTPATASGACSSAMKKRRGIRTEQYGASAVSRSPPSGVTSATATYAPSANNDPCARLITSMTPMINMNPSATSANSSPSAMPFNRCGPSVTTSSMPWSRGASLLFVGRRALVRLEFAGLGRFDVAHLARLRPRHDLEVIGRVRRLVVARGQVDRLLNVVRLGIDPGVVVLQPVLRRHLVTLERLDDLDVVRAARALDGPDELPHGHVAVVEHVAGNVDACVRPALLIATHEVGDAGQRQLVVPRGAEHAEDGLDAEAIDVRPVLLVVEPRRLLVEAELDDLLPHDLEVVTADGGRHHVGLRLLDLEEDRRKVACADGHEDLVHDLGAEPRGDLAGGLRGVVTPDVVIGEQLPALAEGAHGVVGGSQREVGAAAVPDELHALAVLAGLRGRAGVGVEVHAAVLLRHLSDGIGHARLDGPHQEGDLVARDHPLGHP